MVTTFLRAALVAGIACTFGLGVACADIYTFVDANGAVNVSNLPPPEGARVTGVTHETPQKVAALYEAARETAREAELQALADRVRQLEKEADAARREPPPATLVVNPVVMQWAPVQNQIEITQPAPASSGCDVGWWGCGSFWGSGYYFPGSVVVPRPPRPHNIRPVRPEPIPPPFSLRPLFGASHPFRGG